MTPISIVIINIMFGELAVKDALWALGSLLFCFCYVSYHLKSLFLGFITMFHAIISFPITLVIYRVIFAIDYLSSVHIIVLFITLGIAADDSFVFHDAWV